MIPFANSAMSARNGAHLYLRWKTTVRAMRGGGGRGAESQQRTEHQEREDLACRHVHSFRRFSTRRMVCCIQHTVVAGQTVSRKTLTNPLPAEAAPVVRPADHKLLSR